MSAEEAGVNAIEQAAANALLRAVASATPLPLVGTKARPGIFAGRSRVVLAAAEQCHAQGWVAATGELVGRGRLARELYAVTPTGAEFALKHGEVAVCLRSVQESVQSQAAFLQQIRESLCLATDRVTEQSGLIDEIARRTGAVDSIHSAGTSQNASRLAENSDLIGTGHTHSLTAVVAASISEDDQVSANHQFGGQRLTAPANTDSESADSGDTLRGDGFAPAGAGREFAPIAFPVVASLSADWGPIAPSDDASNAESGETSAVAPSVVMGQGDPPPDFSHSNDTIQSRRPGDQPGDDLSVGGHQWASSRVPTALASRLTILTPVLLAVVIFLQITQWRGGNDRNASTLPSAAINSSTETRGALLDNVSESAVIRVTSAGGQPDTGRHPETVAPQDAEVSPWPVDFTGHEAERHSGRPGIIVTCGLSEAVVDWIAAEGTEVVAGEIVARLISPELDEWIYQQGSLVHAARTRQILAHRDVALIEIELAGFDATVRSSHEQDAELNVLEAEQYLARSEVLKEHAERLSRKGYASAESVRPHEIACLRARLTLQSAVAERDQIAPAELTQAYRALTARRDTAQALASLADQHLATEQGRLAELESTRKQLQVLAPESGVVEPANSGGLMELPGTTIRRGRPILRINTSPVTK